MFPQDEIRKENSFNFAPMIDFLFLCLALFATLAVSRAVLYDTEVDLAKLKPEAETKNFQREERHPLHLSIGAEGKYKWLTEFQEYPMENAKAVQEEMSRQYKIGALPQEKERTEVLLHIDKQAPWESIANLIFAIREIGFSARPVYEAAE